MAELYELIEPAEFLVYALEQGCPDFGEFEKTEETIDIGYDCFWAPAYVCGAFYLRYDEEEFGRDCWGWSGHIDYMDGNRYCTFDGPYKCFTEEEALEGLAEYMEDYRQALIEQGLLS